MEYVYTALLTVNAFFIRNLILSLNELKMEMIKVTVQHSQTVEFVKENKTRILLLEQENSRSRERLHSLEYLKTDNK